MKELIEDQESMTNPELVEKRKALREGGQEKVS